MKYRKAGESGIYLPEISLGLWHNFGDIDDFEEARRMILSAFEHGICHFDLANNYGPPAGSAESNFGRILAKDLSSHRDELFISSKAGHDMWAGVYGTGSSRKNLIASCNASLKRTGLEYFDVFYSHRYDGVTPVEETMQALIDIVRQGKALYAGISKYPPREQQRAYDILREAKVPCVLSQYRASIFDTAAIEENFGPASANGSGIVCFSPLAQGLLTDKYLCGVPENSRAARASGYLRREEVTSMRIEAARKLNEIAEARGMTLAQLAIAWLRADSHVTAGIIGASSAGQLEANVKAVEAPALSAAELCLIREVAEAEGVKFV